MADYSLVEAAKRLGATTEAVRARVKRKSLEGFQDNKGRWRVFLPDGQTPDRTLSSEASSCLSEQVQAASEHDLTTIQMRERIAWLEGKLEGAEARLSDRDRELMEVKAERDRLLTLIGEAQSALAKRHQGIFLQLWNRLFGG